MKEKIVYLVNPAADLHTKFQVLEMSFFQEFADMLTDEPMVRMFFVILKPKLKFLPIHVY